MMVDFSEFQKKFRAKFMPTGDKLAQMAQDKMSVDKKIVEEKFNSYLKKLLDIEFEIYQQWEDKCSKNIILESVKRKYIKDLGTFEDSLIHNYKQISEFYLSISQSRKSRAGVSFENQIKYLFNLLDYPFETQTHLNGIVDYLIPGKEAFFKNRTACVVISIKRTLRERWREVIGELASTNAGSIYILTADSDISSNKVDEMANHNVNLVIWDELKESKFNSNYNVFGYTTFIRVDLPSSRKKWESLI